MKVYVVAGWFGDQEWFEEPFYSRHEDAKERCDELWKTRMSEKGPKYAEGLHKFAVEEYEVA